MPDGSLQAISENGEVFPPFVITGTDDVEILGRVRNHSHQWD